MTRWMRRLRGAIGMGLTWAVIWAVVGLLVGVASLVFPFLPWAALFDVFDAPLPALAVPGFVCGALFSLVLGIAGSRRRFHELSLARFAAWGALGGVLLALVPATLTMLGLATIAPKAHGLWALTALLTVPAALLGATSAAGTLLLARAPERRTLGAGAMPLLDTDAPSRALPARSRR